MDLEKETLFISSRRNWIFPEARGFLSLMDLVGSGGANPRSLKV